MRSWELWGGTARTFETGALDPYTAGLEAAGTFADIAAGGPQKREREARARRDEAKYLAEAKQAELALAQAGGAAGGGLGSIGAKLSAPSPIGGLSWGVVAGLAIGGVVLWKVLT